jgi:hypothetical protein
MAENGRESVGEDKQATYYALWRRREERNGVCRWEGRRETGILEWQGNDGSATIHDASAKCSTEVTRFGGNLGA